MLLLPERYPCFMFGQVLQRRPQEFDSSKWTMKDSEGTKRLLVTILTGKESYLDNETHRVKPTRPGHNSNDPGGHQLLGLDQHKNDHLRIPNLYSSSCCCC